MDWKRKLTSRKFWAMLADFIGMMLIAFHVAQDTATQITAMIMAGGGIIAYIIGEAIADAGNATVTHVVESVAEVEFEPPDSDL